MVVGGDSENHAHDAAFLLSSAPEEDACFLFQQPFYVSEVSTPARVLPEPSPCARDNEQAPNAERCTPYPETTHTARDDVRQS